MNSSCKVVNLGTWAMGSLTLMTPIVAMTVVAVDGVAEANSDVENGLTSNFVFNSISLSYNAELLYSA